MNQADRDRLVALKKARDGKMTQRQAAAELQISERQVRRLLAKLRKAGDKAVLHGLRGRSNRRIDAEQRERAVEILKRDVYKGFGPTLASEYLAKKHAMKVSKETVRKWKVSNRGTKPLVQSKALRSSNRMAVPLITG